MGSQFCHLHVHSHFSWDGAATVQALVKAAAEDGQPALALTDHGNMCGAVQFSKACKAEGIRPLIGCEAYVARKSHSERHQKHENPTDHLTLLAVNETGYRNLLALNSIGHVDGFHLRPRMDHEMISQHHEGLIALSGCMSGETSRAIRTGNDDAAMRSAGRWSDIFGKGNFFLEIMRNGVEPQHRVSDRTIEMAANVDIPLVATNDVHYLDRAAAQAHDAYLCIKTGKRMVDETRMRMETEELFLRPADEMAHAFRELPEAVANTLAIGERSDFQLDLGTMHAPVFETNSDESPGDMFDRICEEGFQRLYPAASDAARERLEHEKQVIHDLHFASYFLIVWDLLRFAREHKIPVGPGRGSAAGSIVAYVMDITALDPIDHDLLFERFLNSERMSMPDIDVDVCRDGRERILHYIRDKYGEDHVAQIVTFGVLKARSSIRDVGRVLGVPLGDVDRIAKMIPEGSKVTIDSAMKKDLRLKEEEGRDERTKRLFSLARMLEGVNRDAGIHAAGVVIGDQPLMNLVPLFRAKTGADITTQFDMKDAEAIGLLKMDVLGLRTLTVIDLACRIVGDLTGEILDLDSMPFGAGPGANETYDLLTAADTTGIFQLESSGMRDLLRQMKPSKFEDIVALIALFRPGPLNSGMTQSFVKRHNHQEPVTYPHHLLEDVLGGTHGIIVYQEQVMQVANILGGFTLNQADHLRKAMGKKDTAKMKEYRQPFLEGAAERDVETAVARRTWDLMVEFAEYGFNRSHSAAYAVLSWRTAWLKANHYTAFTCANLTCEADDSDSVKAYLDEARRRGMEILPPDVRHSAAAFLPEGDAAIRFGLAGVKGVGDKAAAHIEEVRREGASLDHLENLCDAVDAELVNKIAADALIKAGAMDHMGERPALLEALPGAMASAQRKRRDRQAGQGMLFGGAAADEAPSFMTAPADLAWTDRKRLEEEKGALGFYLSGHPLDEIRDLVPLISTHRSNALCSVEDGTIVALVGTVEALAVRIIQNGPNSGSRFARFRLQDLDDTVDAVIFSKAFDAVGHLIEDGALLVVTGRTESAGDQVQILVDGVAGVESYLDTLEGVLVLPLPDGASDLLPQLQEILGDQPGRVEVELRMAGQVVRIPTRVRLSAAFLKRLVAILGPDAEIRFRRPRPR